MQASSRNNFFKINFITDSSVKASTVCPVCELMARHSMDSESISANGACTECCTNFEYSGIVDWFAGERPSIQTARSKIAHIFKTGGVS